MLPKKKKHTEEQSHREKNARADKNACLIKQSTHAQTDCAGHLPAARRLAFTLGRY